MSRRLPGVAAGKQHRYRIDRQGEGGWFIGRSLEGDLPDLRLRGVIPGEIVLARPREADPGWGDLLSVESPAAVRRRPRCPLADRCGGCEWQHIELEGQRRLREARLLEALEGSGIDAGPMLSETLGGTEGYGYRYRARFQVGPSRTEGEAGPWIGFHIKGGRRVVDLPGCVVLAPELAGAFEAVRGALGAEAAKGRDLGDLTGVEIIALPRAEGALVQLNPRDRPPAGWPELGRALLERGEGAIAGVGVQARSGERGSSVIGTGSALGWTSRERPVAAALGGFLQGHLEGAELLSDALARCARAREGPRVLELFAGSGLFGWGLAAAGARVTAIEQERGAVEAAQRLPRPPRGGLDLRWGDARAAGTRELWEASDLVVADPPREGLGELATALARSGPPLLVLLSCSVAALSRDLPRLLAGGYRVTDLLPVDLFPHTRHTEVLTRLIRG